MCWVSLINWQDRSLLLCRRASELSQLFFSYTSGCAKWGDCYVSKKLFWISLDSVTHVNALHGICRYSFFFFKLQLCLSLILAGLAISMVSTRYHPKQRSHHNCNSGDRLRHLDCLFEANMARLLQNASSLYRHFWSVPWKTPTRRGLQAVPGILDHHWWKSEKLNHRKRCPAHIATADYVMGLVMTWSCQMLKQTSSWPV